MDDGGSGEDEDDVIEHIGSSRKLFTQYSNVFNSLLSGKNNSVCSFSGSFFETVTDG